MSKRSLARIRVALEWDRPMHELTTLAHQAILRMVGDEYNTLKMGYVAGDIKHDVFNTPGNGRYRTVFRLYTRGRSGIGRKTSWTHVFRFVIALQQLMDALPNCLNAKMECDIPGRHMPWVFTDGYNSTGPTRVWIRNGGADIKFSAPNPIAVYDEVAAFSGILGGSKAKDRQEIPVTDFRVLGESRAVDKFVKFLKWASKQPNLDSRVVSSMAIGRTVQQITQDNLLVMIKDDDRWKALPSTGYVINNIGYAPEVLDGRGEEYGFDFPFMYHRTTAN